MFGATLFPNTTRGVDARGAAAAFCKRVTSGLPRLLGSQLGARATAAPVGIVTHVHDPRRGQEKGEGVGMGGVGWATWQSGAPLEQLDLSALWPAQPPDSSANAAALPRPARPQSCATCCAPGPAASWAARRSADSAAPLPASSASGGGAERALGRRRLRSRPNIQAQPRQASGDDALARTATPAVPATPPEIPADSFLVDSWLNSPHCDPAAHLFLPHPSVNDSTDPSASIFCTALHCNVASLWSLTH